MALVATIRGGLPGRCPGVLQQSGDVSPYVAAPRERRRRCRSDAAPVAAFDGLMRGTGADASKSTTCCSKPTTFSPQLFFAPSP
jgi:hypothetical protein